MKNIAILGSTGSIGTQALEIVRMYPEKFNVVGLAAKSNSELLLKQIIQFKPVLASIEDINAYNSIKDDIPPYTTLICQKDGMIQIAQMEQADIMLVSVVGIAGLPAVVAGLKAKKKIALANKEALVTGGKIVSDLVKANNDIIYPVDSEHSAIFQCLQGNSNNKINNIILTASGGPFRNYKKEQLLNVTAKDALKHPTWNMGNKITIDSSTIMNKGLEVIEAKWLFDVPVEKIKPLIHPESIVHSAVEFEDGALIAQMGEPDMKLPIMYAFEYPDRIYSGAKHLDLAQKGSLTFFEPDYDKFPCLQLAFEAIKMGGNIPCALNAANEVAVDLFLNGKIGFCDIPQMIEHTIFNTDIIKNPTIDDIYETDRLVRIKVSKGG
ncbi:MAG: 1-deoxy-D-xylulose-5-phosphate reductoisomerase [Clostridiales bacterium]|nr:1-deoxy-D-xylulose-5-phosphate reductoisomerase [Clostridiales bacterium]